MADEYGILPKVKRALSIEEADHTHDDYLNDLIESMVNLALSRTGRITLNDEIITIVEGEEVIIYVPNAALVESVVKNVALKFDDLNVEIDYTTFHQYNPTPMI